MLADFAPGDAGRAERITAQREWNRAEIRASAKSRSPQDHAGTRAHTRTYEKNTNRRCGWCFLLVDVRGIKASFGRMRKPADFLGILREVAGW